MSLTFFSPLSSFLLFLLSYCYIFPTSCILYCVLLLHLHPPLVLHTLISPLLLSSASSFFHLGFSNVLFQSSSDGFAFIHVFPSLPCFLFSLLQTSPSSYFATPPPPHSSLLLSSSPSSLPSIHSSVLNLHSCLCCPLRSSSSFLSTPPLPPPSITLPPRPTPPSPLAD